MASLRQWFYLLVLALIWGSSFILIKRGLYTASGDELFSGAQVGALRIIIAALFMLPFSLRKRKLLKNGKLKYYLIVGLCGNALPAFLFATAQTEIPSALAGMLNATVPLFSLLIALFIFKVRITNFQIFGLILGLGASVGLLLYTEGGVQNDFNVWYAALVLVATLCYAISLNTIKQFLQHEPAIAITGLALVLVSPLGIAVLFSSDFISRLTQIEGAWQGLGAVALLAIVGTALALILFNKLVQDTNTIFASSVTYLIPLVAIVWGLADGEGIALQQMGFAGLMLAGVLLINRK